MKRTPRIGLFLVLLAIPAAAQQADDPEKYLLLATSRTGTMEEELNEAGGSRLPRRRGTRRGDGVRRGTRRSSSCRWTPKGGDSVHPAGDESHRHHAGRTERGAP